MVTEILHQSWLSRLGKSFLGVVFGILLFGGGMILLGWNEGRAVKTATGLKEGAAIVVSLDETSPNPAHNEHLVHVTGAATTEAVLQDPVFKVSGKMIKLRRKAEMFQWEEKSKEESKSNLGGSSDTTKTYTYEKVWSETLISSGDFHDSSYKNPTEMPLRSLTQTASPVTLGGFTLNGELVEEMDRFEPLPVPESLPKGFKSEGGTVYKSANLESPEIGSLRVTFYEVEPADVSVVALQQGKDLQPYPTKTGTTINMLSYGHVPAGQMFAEAQKANTILTWILRVAGFFLLFLGGVLVFSPFAVLADVIPFLGSLVGFGTALLALLIAIPVGFIIIALAWLAYRPLLGGTLLVLGIGIPIALLVLRQKRMVPAGT